MFVISIKDSTLDAIMMVKLGIYQNMYPYLIIYLNYNIIHFYYVDNSYVRLYLVKLNYISYLNIIYFNLYLSYTYKLS